MKRVKRKVFDKPLLVLMTILYVQFGFVSFSFSNSFTGESSRLIHIEVFLEGFFDCEHLEMGPAQTFLDGVQSSVFDEDVADIITVSLHEAVNYQEYEWGEKLVFEKNTLLTNDGNAWVALPDIIEGEPLVGSFWVAISHRNHLETIYHSPLNIENDEVYHCDFIRGTLTENNSLGNNQAYLGKIIRGNEITHAWAMYAGDISGDGRVDLVDRNILRLSMANGNRGI